MLIASFTLFEEKNLKKIVQKNGSLSYIYMEITDIY